MPWFLQVLLLGFLLLSIAGNGLLLQDSLAQRNEAERLRTRIRTSQEDYGALEKRLGELQAERGGRSPTGRAPEQVVLRRIEDQVSRLRGLPRRSDVELRFLDRDALRQYFVDSFQQDYLPHEREMDQKLLVTLGLLHPNDNLVQLLLDLLQEQVIGIYDDDERAMYLVGDADQFDTEAKVTFAHEYTHALQDQYFDLSVLSPKHPDNADRSLAIHALIEGDAVFSQQVWARDSLTPEEQASLPSEGSSLLDQAPLVMRIELLFPYVNGFNFVYEAYQRGSGVAAVDELFRNPPESTEQVLHPQKYRDGEKPLAVTLPDLTSTLGDGWRFIGTNVLGELDTQILLQQFGDRVSAQRGAAGWGGDRWQLLEKDGSQAIILRSTWDTDNDAREFFDTYAQGLKNRFTNARQDEASNTRQTLTTPTAATDLRRSGRDVLAVLSFDRASTDAIVAAVGGF